MEIRRVSLKRRGKIALCERLVVVDEVGLFDSERQKQDVECLSWINPQNLHLKVIHLPESSLCVSPHPYYADLRGAFVFTFF